MEHEVRHRMSMAQMLHPTTTTPPADVPEIQLVYTQRNSYMDDFRVLENRILQDVGDNESEATAR